MGHERAHTGSTHGGKTREWQSSCETAHRQATRVGAANSTGIGLVRRDAGRIHVEHGRSSVSTAQRLQIGVNGFDR
jgi:hypothetical protein